jgi:hypothetical protein
LRPSDVSLGGAADTIPSASQTVSAWGTAPTQPGSYGAAPIRERGFHDLSNADKTVVHVPTGNSPARGGEDCGPDAAYSQKGYHELDVSDDEDVEHNPGSSPQDSSLIGRRRSRSASRTVSAPPTVCATHRSQLSSRAPVDSHRCPSHFSNTHKATPRSTTTRTRTTASASRRPRPQALRSTCGP